MKNFSIRYYGELIEAETTKTVQKTKRHLYDIGTHVVFLKLQDSPPYKIAIS